jgi:hypothetical protein
LEGFLSNNTTPRKEISILVVPRTDLWECRNTVSSFLINCELEFPAQAAPTLPLTSVTAELLFTSRNDSGPLYSTMLGKECLSSWIDYNVASTAWLSSHATKTTSTVTLDTTYIINAGRGDLYTDSTGIARLANYTFTSAVTSILNRTYESVDLATRKVESTAPFPGVKPSCSINKDDCDDLRDSYYASSENNPEVRLEQNGTPFIYDPAFPECEGRKCECVVHGTNIALIYWPPERVDENSNFPRTYVLKTDAITLVSTNTMTSNESILSSSLSTTGNSNYYTLSYMQTNS